MTFARLRQVGVTEMDALATPSLSDVSPDGEIKKVSTRMKNRKKDLCKGHFSDSSRMDSKGCSDCGNADQDSLWISPV